MINFFRKKRKLLADDNKALKYTRYAIGEIVLVVIGILIALQINTWNQDRIAKIEERSILKNIHSEFLQNKKVLKEIIEYNKEGYKTTQNILELIGEKDLEKIKNQNLDSLLFFSLEANTFNPSDNSISDLLQSGNFKLLHNDNLKALLYQWDRGMKKYLISSLRKEKKIDDDIIPYLSKNYSMIDIDRYGELKWKNKTLIKIDKLQILEDIEFENIMDDYLYRLNGETKNLLEFEKIMDNILKETT
jgi:hypothetical protein